MGRQYNRAGVLERRHREIASGRPIYLVGAGIGISAKFAEKGGADLIATYGLARYRMAGLSSMAAYLPICDNNALTLDRPQGPEGWFNPECQEAFWRGLEEHLRNPLVVCRQSPAHINSEEFCGEIVREILYLLEGNK